MREYQSVLFLFMLHFTEGCQLSGNRESKEVTCYTGGSVLLPCSCTDPQSTVKFTWLVLHGSQRNEVFKNENYKGRWKLFNESFPANLSLLISDLRKEDEGSYRCEILGRNYTDIRVNIKGCDLDQNKQTVEVTGHSGESVVLPCSCTELQDKPLQLTWTYTPLNQTKPEEIYPNEQSERHRGRVKLLDQTSPGNLSLLISDLNTEDQGEYHCSVLQQQHVNIRLRVQEADNKSLFILLSVLPVVMLLAVLALIYWKCRGRRDVKKMNNDGLVLVCSENENQADVIPDNLTQGQNLKQDQNEDEVTYTSVVHVKTAAKPADKQTVMEEHSEN
ncbi:junctional adhesion molecule-like isoform X2 [Chanodichthys erythropterus]|uniref:junctional adhesion molecule-like isoform X2 n=1 Tax=Chanodichthys erythropterus TaxID=933992 RepID=UPI00351E8C19